MSAYATLLFIHTCDEIFHFILRFRIFESSVQHIYVVCSLPGFVNLSEIHPDTDIYFYLYSVAALK